MTDQTPITPEWPCPEKVDTINVLKVARILPG